MQLHLASRMESRFQCLFDRWLLAVPWGVIIYPNEASTTNAALPAIFVDECGFTGEDLANEDQVVMVVASHCISEREATALKGEFFGQVRAPELKHASLQRRAIQQDMVVACLTAMLDTDRVRATLAYKPFCVIMKMVDWLIEPAMHDAGFNPYERGGHVAMAEVIFATLQAHGDPVLHRAARAFQRAVRSRRREDVIECHRALLTGAVADALANMPNPFARPIAELGLTWVDSLPPNPLDISLPLAIQNCLAWREAGWVRFAVVHDRSSNMAKNGAIWDALLSPEAPAAAVGWGQRHIDYPIGVSETRFVDSQASDAIQLADVVAGATARWAKWFAAGKNQSDAYGVKLEEVLLPRLDKLVWNVIWPTRDVTGWPVAPASVVDPNEYAAALLLATRNH